MAVWLAWDLLQIVRGGSRAERWAPEPVLAAFSLFAVFFLIALRGVPLVYALLAPPSASSW